MQKGCKTTQIDPIILNLDGTDAGKYFDTHPYDKLHSDGEYLYTDSIKWSRFSKPKDEQEFAVYNADGEKLASVNPNIFSTDSSELIGASEKHIFYKNAIELRQKIYYADKSDIESGKLEFKLLLNIEFENMN